ncbi:MAG: hypothetical protein CL740_01800 [Chloroflexi bacterium]|nr:hypothetical protein [Chloroflexota bacterium]|tara:strand:+ start:703 stop:1800 length:1098 start_codon:yes stop_codon:yes gene_type:complete
MNNYKAFIGTYTQGGLGGGNSKNSNIFSDGIYTVSIDSDTGEISIMSSTKNVDVTNPSFVHVSSSKKYLYSVSEVTSERTGSVASFEIDKERGTLKFINKQITKGTGPCHINSDPSDSVLITANYAGGSVSFFPINDDGSISELSDFKQHKGSSINKNRQEAAHAHSVSIDVSGKYAYVCDLGLDKIFKYEIDYDENKLFLEENSIINVMPGSGPRHFTFHPNNKKVFVINELGGSVLSYDLGKDGSLNLIETVDTLPKNYNGDSWTADIHTSIDGNYVYGSNRGHDSIAIFKFDESKNTLDSIGHHSSMGETPRNFALSPDGKFLFVANQDTNNIATLKINDDGSLSDTGHNLNIPSPVCIKFL